MKTINNHLHTVFMLVAVIIIVVASFAITPINEVEAIISIETKALELAKTSGTTIINNNRLQSNALIYADLGFYCSALFRYSEKLKYTDPVSAQEFKAEGAKMADHLVNHKDMNNNSTVGWGWYETVDAYIDGSVNPAHTEYTYQTPVAANCLLDAYEVTANTIYLDTAKAAMTTFWSKGTSSYVNDCNNCFYFWYSAHDNDQNRYVKNTNALMGMFASRLCKITDDNSYCERAIQVYNAEKYELDVKSNYYYYGSKETWYQTAVGADDHLAIELVAIDEMAHNLNKIDYADTLTNLANKYWDQNFCPISKCDNFTTSGSPNVSVLAGCYLAHHGGIHNTKCSEAIDYFYSTPTILFEKASFAMAQLLPEPVPVQLTLSQTSIDAGQTVRVSWSNAFLPNSSDWIGMYLQNGSDQKDWKYTSTCTKTLGTDKKSSGYCDFTLSTAGTYEFKLFPENLSTNILATSSTVLVKSLGGLNPPPVTPPPVVPPPTTPSTPKDGTLIKDGNTIYVIEHGKKRGFTTWQNFVSLGYKPSRIMTYDSSQIVEGQIINSTTIRHPRGSLVLHQGTVYFLGAEIRYPFPSAAVFLSWENKFEDIILANSNDLAMPLGPIVEMKK